MPRFPHMAGALAIALASAGAAASLAQAAPRPTCHGFPVTVAKASGLVVGTARRDVIRLTGPAHVRAGAGPDIICGSRFADVIEAGGGDDVVLGGPGHDRIRGGAGPDNLFGEGGHDHLHGGAGPDLVHGGAGRNHVDLGTGPRRRETGLSDVLDTELTGQQVVSIVTDRASLVQMMGRGSGYAFWWPSVQPQVPTVVWATGLPVLNTALVVTGGAGVFTAGPAPMPPEGITQVAATTPVAWGQQVSVGPGGAQASGIPAGAPNAVQVQNTDTQGVGVVAGLALGGSLQGAPFTNPAQAANLWSYMIATFTQPTTLGVQAPAGPLLVGSNINQMPLGASTTASFSPGHSIVTLRYSAAVGFRAGISNGGDGGPGGGGS